MDTEITCSCQKTTRRSPEEVHALLNRLSRIEGQIRGIRGMVEKDAYCVDILTQITAATAALNGVSRELLTNHIRTCVTRDLQEGRDDVVEELIQALRSMMK